MAGELLRLLTFPMMDKNSWLVAHFHNGFSYWIYGCMGVLAALFMWKFVPETKGKTLEELEALRNWKRRKHNKLLRCNLPVQHAAPVRRAVFLLPLQPFRITQPQGDHQ